MFLEGTMDFIIIIIIIIIIYNTYFNTKKGYIFSTEVTCVFRVILNTDKLFLYQHFAIGLCNGNAGCMVCGTNQVFVCYLGYTTDFTG
jgi:hypothetical protein